MQWLAMGAKKFRNYADFKSTNFLVLIKINIKK